MTNTTEIPEEYTAEGRKNHEQLTRFLVGLSSKFSDKKILMSRGNDGFGWLQTGLYIDESEGRLYGKAGDRPAQPLGMITDGVFVPNQANKLFWARAFAWFEVTDDSVDLPFQVEKVTLSDEQLGLSDAMLVQARAVLDEMRLELDKLVAMTPEQRVEQHVSVREYTKLLRLKFPPMDKFLSENEARSEDTKAALEAGDPVALLATLADWVNHKIQDEEIRRKLTGNVLVRKDLDAANSCLATVGDVLNGDPDEDRENRVLSAIYIMDPLVREGVDGLIAKKKSPRQVLEYLKGEFERRIANG